MIDVTTNKPLRISVGPRGHAEMRLAVSQLDDVRGVLDRHGVNYWLIDGIMSFNGGPEITYIGFSRNNNHEAVQAMLDAVA